jgi:hypothetical protein
LYAAEYLRECKEYTQSWKKLKEGIKHWRADVPNNPKTYFKQVKADICKFILEECVLEGQPFFDEDDPLAYEPKYKRLRQWDTKMCPSDYK